MIEFLAWYHAGSDLVRCGGDGGCGALLVSGDTELHKAWHEKINPPGQPEMPFCTDPNCTIPRKPGRPAHGPHDFRARTHGVF